MGQRLYPLRFAARLALFLILILPYWIWWQLIGNPSQPPAWPRLIRPAATALLQASLSACGSIILGLLLFLSLQSLSRGRKVAEWALLMPNLLPPLFFIFSLLAWIAPWAAFPYGLTAVIVAHIILNSGLVAIALDRAVQNRLGGIVEVAWLLGSSRRLFWRKIFLPLMRADLASIFLFVFSLALTSFSIPLILGGPRQTSLEVAIFNAIRLEGRWDVALWLTFTQMAFLIFFAQLLPRPRASQQAYAPRALPLLASRSLGFLIFLPAMIVIFGTVLSLTQIAWEWPQDWWDAAQMSLALGLCVGALHLLFFLWLIYVSPSSWLERFLRGYLAPSAAITGCGLLFLPGSTVVAGFFKLSLALTLISFPLLYRWIVHSALIALRAQIQVARLLGASWSSILFAIVWPQIGSRVLRACGLAAFWASGDFAVSGLLANGFNTLPLLIENLMAQYRFASAHILLLPLLATGLLLYGFYMGAARYVAR